MAQITSPEMLDTYLNLEDRIAKLSIEELQEFDRENAKFHKELAKI